MCSVIILRNPSSPYPLVLGANRDEMADRPWQPPGRHWPDRPNVVAGLDDSAGGSWMGLNDEGVVAAVLNRRGTLGPEAGKRSRGELVLESLDHADAADAALALGQLDTRAYRPFNLLVADNRDAFVVLHRGDTPRHRPEVVTLGPGLHMLTALDPDDAGDPRVRLYLPLFRQAAPPDPTVPDWGGWPELLGSRIWEGDSPRGAMDFQLPTGFGTSSSALLALPSAQHPDRDPVWHFAPGRPHATPWSPVSLG